MIINHLSINKIRDSLQLLPSSKTVRTPFVIELVVLKPHETTEAHGHKEGEAWFIMNGIAEIKENNVTYQARQGDLIYLPAESVHQITNLNQIKPMTFITIWWK